MMANTIAIENKTILVTGDLVVGRRKNTIASKLKSSGALVLIAAMFIIGAILALSCGIPIMINLHVPIWDFYALLPY